MNKKSGMRGKSTSKPEVIGITAHGIWILVRGVEYFASFNDFPWFKNATVAAIYSLTESHPGHLYWSHLDVDLHIDSLKNPAAFPLLAKSPAAKPTKKRTA